MEPTTLLIAGTTYAAALVGRKVANEATEAFWNHVKMLLKKTLGREPTPSDVSSQAIEELSGEPAVRSELERLLGTSSVLRRAKLVESVLSGRQILWVDDQPEGNVWEFHCLSALGCVVKTLESTESALRSLAVEPYDLILSDVARRGNPNAGLDALPKFRQAAPDTKVILYVGTLKAGVPAGAFGITNRPDELLHLCMDVLERRPLV